MAQWTRCFVLYALGSEFRTLASHTNQAAVADACRPTAGVGTQRKEDPWGSLASQPSQNGQIQAKQEFLSQSTWWQETKDIQHGLLPCVCISAYVSFPQIN